MRSTSSLLREYLLQAEDVGPHTAVELLKLITDWAVANKIEVAPTPGGVSGFMSKAQMAGAVVPGRDKGYMTYTVVDKVALRAMSTKGNPGVGGAEGREVHRRPRKPQDTASIQQRLLDLAAELELVRSPLGAYTTAELLAEIKLRMDRK